MKIIQTCHHNRSELFIPHASYFAIPFNKIVANTHIHQFKYFVSGHWMALTLTSVYTPDTVE